MFHESVGLTMVACVLLLRQTRALEKFNTATRWLLTAAITIPTGFFIGHQIAFLLLGESLRLAGYLDVSLIPVLFTLMVGGLGLHAFATREQLAREAAALDYLLKPVTAERLEQTVARIKAGLATRPAAPAAGDRAALMQRMQSFMAPQGGADEGTERIRVIHAGIGNTVRMIPVADVICFEATEKFVNVVTATGEALVRMSLRELMARIDPTDFIQVHRGVIVNANAILSATRDDNGHYSLAVRGLERPLKVSRAFGHLFRPM